MARTERRRPDWTGNRRDPWLNESARDRKPKCWCCSGWLRVDRRQKRHDAKAALVRGEE